MNLKRLWLYVLSLLLLMCLLFQQMSYAAPIYNEVPPDKAVEIAIRWAATEDLVRAGGTYKEGEYQSFIYQGKTYRYMASQFNSKKKLMAELQKSVTKKEAKKFIKDQGIIKHERKLAQIEADGGSILRWEWATASVLKSKKNKKVFELTVPIGDTGTADKFKVTYVYVKKTGWRISKLPVQMK